MKCDVSAVLNNDGAALKIAGKVEPKDDCGQDILFDEAVSVSGDIVCRGSVLALSADVAGKFKTHCARCLKTLEIPLSFHFEETLAQNGENVTDKDSVILFSGTSIDLSDIVISNILLNLSYRYLCREDCRGLCPKCGKDLNLGSCGCDDDEIDPRWEVLKNFK